MSTVSQVAPTASDAAREHSRLAVALAFAVVVLGFLPYAALPAGANTNLPLSTFASVALIALTMRHRGVFWTTFAVLVLPFASTLLQMAFAPHAIAPAPMVAWIAYSLALPGAMAAYVVLGPRLRPLLAWCLIGSSVMVYVQFVLIKRGTLPWLWYYGAPGYHPVRENAESIILYNNRPFGLFPEPSFMAGTLAMVLMVVLTLRVAERRIYGPLEWASLVLVLGALLLSSSGSTVMTLGLIAFAAILPLLRRSRVVIAALPSLALATVAAALVVLSDRGTGAENLSWVDRSSSLFVGLDRFTDTAAEALTGLGIGMTTYLFEHGGMPLFRYEHYTPIPDVYSVTLRVLIEMGLLIGLPVLLWLCTRFVVPSDRELFLVALATLGCWLIVASLTITYHSAFWICGVPGVMAILKEKARSGAFAPAGSIESTESSR